MVTIHKNKPEVIACPAYMPESLADENYAISLMFYSLERAEEVVNLLEPGDFYNEFNRKVFLICSELTDASITITAAGVSEEMLRRLKVSQEEIAFDFPTVYELQSRYQSQYQVIDKEGLAGSVRRLKLDAAYREIIYRAEDALIMARMREGSPLEIVAPLETFGQELQAKTSRVIVWADEAEREAQETYDKLDAGELVAIPTGFPEIDAKLYGGGTWAGDLIVGSGVTSGGKTTLALNIATNAGELGIANLYFTMEMKIFKIFSRQHSSRSRIPGYKIRPNMSALYPHLNIREKLRDSGYPLSKLPIGYIDNVRDMESIRRVTKFAVREFGVKQITIDYLGLTSPSKRFKGSPFERASIVAEKAKELAQECSISVFALAQLRRKYKEEKNGGADADGNDIEPTLDMLKNSGDIENFADTVIFLWGEKGKEGEQDAIRNIHGRVAKQRNGVLFPFELKFAPAIFTFSSLEQLTKLREEMDAAEF